MDEQGARLTVAHCLARLPESGALRYLPALERATLSVGLYAPALRDEQTPHRRDEVYVVIEGLGDFVMGEQRVPFAPGDLLFVPAGMSHRFENFGPSLVAWVIFVGPAPSEEPQR